MMKILVVDDHPIVREGLRRLLSGQPDMEVVAAVSDREAALALLNEEPKVNMLLTDVSVSVASGLELIKRSVTLRQDLVVVVLTFHSLLVVKQPALEAGAKVCISKDSDIDQLLSSIRMAYTAN